tara:strand:+ start:1596 stop:1832 length:237 start_codon:yes stop_codon:yes gene_type:complete
MGEVEKQWNEKKAERRKEYLEALRAFQTKEHKARFVSDAKKVKSIAEHKLERVDLTKEEIQECNNIIENSNLIINKHK